MKKIIAILILSTIVTYSQGTENSENNTEKKELITKRGIFSYLDFFFNGYEEFEHLKKENKHLKKIIASLLKTMQTIESKNQEVINQRILCIYLIKEFFTKKQQSNQKVLAILNTCVAHVKKVSGN